MTVIIPAFNSEETLARAVNSALAQTRGDLEVIVVGDGSAVVASEGLAHISDPWLRVIRHAANEGAAAARNSALRAARTPLVSQLDSDDLWLPTYVERMVPLFNFPAVGLAYCNAYIDGGPAGLTHAHWPGERHPIDTFPELAKRNPITACTVTMRTDAVKRAGGYLTKLGNAEDYYLYLRLAAMGWRFGYMPETLARYNWPTAERGQSFYKPKRDKNHLKMALTFSARHPRTRLPARVLGGLLARWLRHQPGFRWIDGARARWLSGWEASRGGRRV